MKRRPRKSAEGDGDTGAEVPTSEAAEPPVASRAKAAARFIDEARAIHRIDHKNVVDIYDMGELRDGSLFLVMELLEGEDLSERLAAVGVLL